jgi:hypothetical protein
MSVKLLSVLTLAVTLACAASGPPGRTGRDSTTIAADEIEASHESNAYDAVAKLRPGFLRSRGRTTINSGASEYPSVFVDGQFYGDLSSLRTIIAPQVKQIHYYNGPDAVTRFGMQYGSGAIEVTTR